MSEFDTMKNMFIREGVKFVEENEKEIDEETGIESNTTFLCVPAVADEFLILGFDEDGSLIYVDVGADWDDYLERVKELEDVKIY